MGLKTIFQMTKTDRYTQDGRDELAKLQETEDVTYKIGDISQKTGLQKTANGWVKPKGGQGKQSAKQEEKGAPKQKKENPAEKMNLSEGQKKILEQQEAKGGQPNPDLDLKQAGLEGKKTWQEKQTEKLQKKMQEKAGAGKPEAGKTTVRQGPNTKELMEKYKDLPGAQKKDALYASTFEGIPIGMTQESMERQGWDLISTGEETGENVNVYAKPDGSKVTMKHDGKTITSTEYEAPGNAESKAWADRSKNERTATLVDWLDDWDKHPEEKNDAAYAAIEKELASRGVNRAGRQDAKKADNAGRNEFYRRAYEGDAAPRQLTGDCRIRIRKEKPKLTGDTRIRVKK